jgi:hypothetical protein
VVAALGGEAACVDVSGPRKAPTALTPTNIRWIRKKNSDLTTFKWVKRKKMEIE